MTQAVTSAFSSGYSWQKRGVVDRRFSGAIVCAKDDNTATAVAKLYYVSGSGSHLMDSVSLSPGKSAVWTEEDYGVVLHKNDYMKIVVSGDEVNCWLNTYDTYL